MPNVANARMLAPDFWGAGRSPIPRTARDTTPSQQMKHSKRQPNALQLGLYLKGLRIRSGTRSVSEYLKSVNLKNISETYYRALENGDKLPTVDTVQQLAAGLSADRFVLFQHYLEDLLPEDVSKKLINPVSGQVPASSPKEALERKDEMLDAYRASLNKQGAHDIVEDTYLADDAMVDFLDQHFELLPLVHFIYLKEGEISEDELRSTLEANNIDTDLESVMSEFKRHRIADICNGPDNRRFVRRFSRAFHLPPTSKGKALRVRWMKTETQRSLSLERSDQIQPDKTFSFGMINQYDHAKLRKVQERIMDAIAEMHAATVPTILEGSSPFFFSIIVSPRPEYAPVPACETKTTNRVPAPSKRQSAA